MSRQDLIALAEELLAAHLDTLALARELEPDLEWEAHLEYLRSLVRFGQAVLAASAAEQTAT
jgi:hypothetical protein